jgi:YD repeat-containing protein
MSDAFQVVADIKLTRDRATAVTFSGGGHRFDYAAKSPRLLSEYRRPGVSKPENFGYDPVTEVLKQIESPSGEVVKLACEQTGQPGRGPTRCRLMDDGTYKYTYKVPAGDTSIEATDRAGAKALFSYQMARGIVTRQELGGSKTVTYYYRAPGQRYDGRLRRIERDGQLVVDHTYDPKTGHLVGSRDASGQITTYEYRQSAKAAKDDPLYDKPSRIFRGTRKAQELIASLIYDSLGRVTQTTDAAGRTSKIQYSSRGELSAVTRSDGQTVQFQQDPLGHVLSVNNGGKQQKTGYDAATGKVKFRQLPDGQYIDYLYDDCGRVKEIQQRRATVASFDFDETGRVAARRDGLKRETLYRYDKRGNLLEERQPNGAVTRYEYDARNLRTAQIDGKGNRITFKYNEARQLVGQVNPLGKKLTWAYDDKGRITERTNGAQIIKYAHDAKGRLKVINYGAPGEKLVHFYDEKSRLSRVATPTITVNLTYDALDRVVARQMVRGTAERTLRYTYNPSGRKTSVVLSEKTAYGAPRLLHQNEYAYDAAGNLSELKANGRLICRYVHDPVGRLTRREFGNGIEANYAYDDFGRLSRMEIKGGPLLEPMLLAYDWDVAGQVTRRLWNREAQSFAYDAAGQLLTVSVPPENPPPGGDLQKVSLKAGSDAAPETKPVESYRYDPAGNIMEKFERGLTTTMTYDAANQLLKTAASLPMRNQNLASDPSSKTEAYHYDDAGRQNRIEGPGGITDRYYGWLDKVVKLHKPDGTVLGFDYYPDGQLAVKGRIGKIAPVAAKEEKKSPFDLLRNLVSAKNAAAAEIDESLEASPEQRALEATEEFVWDDLALLWRNGSGYAVEPHANGGSCIASFRGPNEPPTYFLNDILGTTLAAVHPDRVEVVSLTAFGKPLKKPTVLPDALSQKTPLSQGNDVLGIPNTKNTP